MNKDNAILLRCNRSETHDFLCIDK